MKHEFLDGCKDKCGSCYLCCLSICKVCGLAEGSLTTDCPGVQSQKEYGDLVYKGKIDYRDGKWIYGKISPHSPSAYLQRFNER